MFIKKKVSVSKKMLNLVINTRKKVAEKAANQNFSRSFIRGTQEMSNNAEVIY